MFDPRDHDLETVLALLGAAGLILALVTSTPVLH